MEIYAGRSDVVKKGNIMVLTLQTFYQSSARTPVKNVAKLKNRY